MSRVWDVLEKRAGLLYWTDPEVERVNEAGLPDAGAQAIAVAMHSALRRASLYWVSPEMCEVCFTAAAVMPESATWRKEERPAESGLVLFARPGWYEDEDGNAEKFDLLLWNGEESLNLSDVSELSEHGWIGGEKDAEWGSAPFGPIDDVLLTFWKASSQRIAVQSSGFADRASRRRLDRLKMPVDVVQLVTLRRPAPRGEREGESNPVDWSHRWIVDAHWRNQYHPSTGEHVPTLIGAHVKGPEDKPLVPKQKLYRWIR